MSMEWTSKHKNLKEGESLIQWEWQEGEEAFVPKALLVRTLKTQMHASLVSAKKLYPGAGWYIIKLQISKQWHVCNQERACGLECHGLWLQLWTEGTKHCSVPPSLPLFPKTGLTTPSGKRRITITLGTGLLYDLSWSCAVCSKASSTSCPVSKAFMPKHVRWV